MSRAKGGMSSEAFNAQKLHEAEAAVQQQAQQEMMRPIALIEHDTGTVVDVRRKSQRPTLANEFIQNEIGRVEKRTLDNLLNHSILIGFLIEKKLIEKGEWETWCEQKQKELDAAMTAAKEKEKAAHEGVAAATTGPEPKANGDGSHLVPTEPGNFAQAEGSSGIVLTD